MGVSKLKHLTLEEKTKIKELWMAGMTSNEIGKLYRVSCGPIKDILKEEGVKLKNRVTSIDLKNIINLWESGVPIKRIAIETKFNPGTIRAKLKQNGFVLDRREIEPRLWTTEEIEQIKTLRKNGFTRRQITSKINCTLGQLRYALNKFDIENVRTNTHKWAAEETARLIKLREERLTIDEISEILKIPESCIVSKLQNLHIKIRNNFWKETEVELLKSLIKQNKSLIEISLLLDRPYSALCSKVKSLGLESIEQKIKNRQIKRHDIKEQYSDIVYVNFTDRHRHLIVQRLRMIERRAKKKAIGFDLSITDIENMWKLQKGRCFYSKKAMSFFGYNYVWTVDRKDSGLGYTKDNSVLCINIVNRMKNSLNLNEFVEFCSIIVSNNPIKATN